jgi:hypothetical protein
MTTIIVANSITAGFVVLALAAVMRLGHLTAGGRFDRSLRRLELHRGSGAEQRTPERRAA